MLFPLFLSAIFVYGNSERPTDKSGKNRFELWGGIDVFFTDKYLNQKGKKWRPIYLFSFLVVLTGFSLIGNFNICV